MPLPARNPDDPRGWLTFTAPLGDDLQRAEDSTQAADYDRARRYGSTFTRPATTTEQTLLAELGHDLGALTEPLTTTVKFLSYSVRRRTWPQLEPPTP